MRKHVRLDGYLGIWGDGMCRVVRQALGAGAGVRYIGASGAEDTSLSSVDEFIESRRSTEAAQKRVTSQGATVVRSFGRSALWFCARRRRDFSSAVVGCF